ncbi:MAG TPA: putative Ig domain-containing protein [Nitrososphaera sp.]|nr:putative Ig domain-containing protein [Nitrososphaera sp.]
MAVAGLAIVAWAAAAPLPAYAQVSRDVAVPELSPVSIQVVANDTDVPAQKLTFNATGLPAWATLNPATGLITGTPGEADNGNSTVTVKVDDGHGGTSSLTFTLTVTEVNSPPKLSLFVKGGNNTAPPMAPPANQTSATPPANQTSATPPPPSTGNQTSSSGGNQTPTLTNNNATLVLTPSTLKPGSQLTIKGSGFGINQQVTFMIDNDTLVTSGQVTTDASGAFTANATLPTGITNGSHQISATSMNGFKSTATITVQA